MLLIGCARVVGEVADPDPLPWASEVEIRFDETYPTVAWVSWEQGVEAESWVEWEAEDRSSSPARLRAAGPQEQVLVGLPYGSALRYRIVSADTESGWFSAETAALPEDFPLPALSEIDPGLVDDFPYLLGSVTEGSLGWAGMVSEFWTFILDRKGRVVWLRETPDRAWTVYAQPAPDGAALLLDESTYWRDWDGGQASVVQRLRLAGEVESTTATPGLHHSFLALEDRLVWGAVDGELEDLVELRDGSIRELWSCADWLAGIGADQSCQSNSLHFDGSSYFFSFYTVETLVEIEQASGATLHAWGRLGGSFEPPESQFFWQHGPSITPEGRLLISSYNPIDPFSGETVVREYAREGDTLVQTWSAGVGEGVWGHTNGEAHRLPNGNTLHNMGDAGRIREWTPGGELAWEIEFGDGHLLGRTLPLDDLYAFAP